MNITRSAAPDYTQAKPTQVAADGVREAMQRLNDNISKVALIQKTDSSGDRSIGVGSVVSTLAEQQQLLREVSANSNSLRTANQTVGTIIDIKI